MNGQTSRRGFLSALAVAGAGALALDGCSSGSSGSTGAAGNATVAVPSKDPTATINVTSILALKADQMQAVLDAFHAAHPTITVNWRTVPFDSLSSTIDANVANKQGDPDVYWADQPRLSAVAARGEARDLTAAFSRYESSFDPSPWKSGLYQGKVFGLPIANSTQLLYYNKTLLSKAGLTPPSSDVSGRMTWEQLTADAAKATKAGAANGFLFGQPNRYYQLECLPVSLGGSAGASGKDNLTPDFTSPAWVKAMTWYGSLYSSGVSPRNVSADQTDPAFLAGKTAYMVEGPWLLPQLQASKIDWGIAPQPTFAGGKPVTADGSWSLAINPFSKNPDAAAVFLKWMAIDGGSGYIKYRTSPELAANVAGKKVYFAKPVFASAEGKKAAQIIAYETANTGVNRVSTIGYLEFETILNAAFSDISNGTPAQQALESASTKLKTAWAKYAGK